ncbi:nucleotidyltransferase family protein [Alisedimentitalea sp. MJ-SS2]|uniref:nucleotidyltransferase family protein n=1 Tax=Aliisedimentitalea sp. MJ-SS2 TaxID=3049795 RepID=UPI00290DD147|nr:nucleotidyltransferase family protein [Alisedimentitalea sp. MJ-SS2]MDU8929812.1 nucleotidyltransferase family protein [Alisedimentitalea sp. MJ-SS2]
MSDVLILIPAAGASRRMQGRDKLLEQIDGEAILTRQTRRALATGTDVLVTLSRDHPDRRAVLTPLDAAELTLLTIDGSEGMAISFRTAASYASDHDYTGVLVALPDMPDLGTGDLCHVLDTFRTDPTKVHRATSSDGRPGHPVVIPKRLFPRLAELRGDQGARMALREETPRLIALPGVRALIDLDTPQEWAAWRDGTGQHAGNHKP